MLYECKRKDYCSQLPNDVEDKFYQFYNIRPKGVLSLIERLDGIEYIGQSIVCNDVVAN